MRTKLLLTALIVLTLFTACKKDETPTVLKISIAQQPSGGYNVNTLTAVINVEFTGPVKPINVSAQWWWETAPNRNTLILQSYSYVFDENSPNYQQIQFDVTDGYILLNYFWLKIVWTDDKGDHVLTTNKVYCQ